VRLGCCTLAGAYLQRFLAVAELQEAIRSAFGLLHVCRSLSAAFFGCRRLAATQTQ